MRALPKSVATLLRLAITLAALLGVLALTRGTLTAAETITIVFAFLTVAAGASALRIRDQK